MRIIGAASVELMGTMMKLMYELAKLLEMPEVSIFYPIYLYIIEFVNNGGF